MSNNDDISLRKYQISVHLSPQNQRINTESKHGNISNDASNNNARSLNIFFNSLPEEVNHETKTYGQSGCDKKTSSSKTYSYTSYADSINLYQINDIEESNINSKCPLLAIPIPNSIIEEVDAKSHQPLHSLNDVHGNVATGEILSSLLPRIHPALTCLHPCILLRTNDSASAKNTTEESTAGIPQNSFQLLVLSVIQSQDSSSLNQHDAGGALLKNGCIRNNRFDTLQQIMDEVNGEPIVTTTDRNPRAVIQAIPISRILFYESFVEEDCCQDEYQRFAISDPFATKPVSSDAQFVKRWDAKDEEGSSGDITSVSMTQELPLCPVCIYRIEPQRLGLPQPKQHHRCTHRCDQLKANNQAAFCNNMEFLSPWSSPSYCRACHVLQERLTLSGAQPFFRSASSSHGMRATASATNMPHKNIRDQLKCYKCGIEETLWMCLTCSVVGCGRYSHGHARHHFHITCHPFSLELATQRIWDYKTSSFIQRDDLLTCPFMQGLLGATNRAAYHGAALGTDKESCGRRAPTRHRMIGTVPKKAVMVGEEYEALLQSVLEDQAQHYQGQISRLRADLTAQDINKADMTKEELMEVEALEIEISKLRFEVDQMSSRALEVQTQEARHREKSNALLREQGVMQQLLDRIREDAIKEQEHDKIVVEGLEQEVSDLTSFISMRQQIAQNQELSNAQICGTSGKQKVGGRKKGLQKFRK